MKSDTEGTGQDVSQRPLSVMALPFGKNQMLVYSPSMGGGFIVAFPELVGTSDPITPAGKVWFQKYGSCDLTFCKIQYREDEAYHCSKTLSFAEKPNETGFSATIPSGNVFQDGGVTAKVVKQDNTGDYAPIDDTEVNLKCRIKYTIPAKGFAYAAIADYSPVYASTTAPGTPVDLHDFATTISLEVPDSPAGVAMHLEGLDPDGIAPTLKSQSNRPLQASRGGILFLDGRTEAPKIEVAPYDDAYHWEIEIRDQWKALEHYYFRDPLPLDDLTLADALGAVIHPAVDCSLDISTDAFTIPLTGTCSQGDWSALVEVGDTSAEWVQRLMETYAGNWIFGFRPGGGGIVFFAKSPDDLGTTPKKVLYGTRAAAIAAAVDNVTESVYRKLHRDFLEPEATEVRVTGYDPIDRRAFQSFKVDHDAEDPTTAVASRPANWLGEKRQYGLFDPSITTQAAADRSCDLLFQRLTPIRDLGEWESAFLVDDDGVPLWRGDNVELDGIGTFRITALRSNWDVDETDGSGWRFQSANYTGEMVA